LGLAFRMGLKLGFGFIATLWELEVRIGVVVDVGVSG
jgi:hypothetical protein